jgi:hypothetical protein
MPSAIGRARAWVLLQVKDPKAVLAEIVKPRGPSQGTANMGLLSWGGEDIVIVRADLVDGDCGWNLVIPVDARNEWALNIAILELTAAAGGHLVAQCVLRVQEHRPAVPSSAHSYVTPAEVKQLRDPAFAQSKRHWPASPGANPWG